MPRMPIKLKAISKPQGGAVIDIAADLSPGVVGVGDENYACPGCGRFLVKGKPLMSGMTLHCGKCDTYCEPPT